MPTGEFQCAASADDAAEAAGNVTITETAPNCDDSDFSQIGLRFPSFTPDNGATFNSIVLRCVFPSGTLDEPNILIHGFYVADCPQFTAGTLNNDITGRTRTTASVLWQSTNLGAPGTFDSPDLSAIFDEICSHPSYASGNAVGLILLANGTSTRDCAFTHYDGSSTNAPKLVADWTEGGGGGGVIVISGVLLDRRRRV